MPKGIAVTTQRVQDYCRCALADLSPRAECKDLSILWTNAKTEACAAKFGNQARTLPFLKKMDACIRSHLGSAATLIYENYAALFEEQQSTALVESQELEKLPQSRPAKQQYARCVVHTVISNCADKSMAGLQSCFDTEPEEALFRPCVAILTANGAHK
jgi:hypothetical protein